MAMQVATRARVINRDEMLRKARLSSFIGTVIEWYEFFIYGAAAALVFGKLFFPQSSPLAGTMAAFGTFAVGFIARPLEGSYSAISVIVLGAARCLSQPS